MRKNVGVALVTILLVTPLAMAGNGTSKGKTPASDHRLTGTVQAPSGSYEMKMDTGPQQSGGSGRVHSPSKARSNPPRSKHRR